MTHMVVGMGQIGTALFDCIEQAGLDVCAADVDIAPMPTANLLYMHICIPGQIGGFCDVVLDYITKYKPSVCIIHGTVTPGTTAIIQKLAKCFVAYSPVRGRHGQLVSDMHEFIKFVGSPTTEGAKLAARALLEIGFTVKIASSAEVLELGKLFQTTYTGLLIAWAQEMSRCCDQAGVGYIESQVMCDMPNLPHVVHQPGFIGGHCIMPNLDVLDQVYPCLFTEAIRITNTKAKSSSERVWPIPFRQNK